ncbi:hypothetical protein EJ03DRAFT_17279 [Teratosphaeria nubilosa]|uniref:CBM1 domain-containing protein n=1 Tax=Teratosphaeria nubilosa TaxID=161662 RepID=A0A6G1KVS0_9PEZI|nr:hypothetical protein EJ03DRAFT_17279 [Teratosphaeria nubilosa]
MLLLTLLLTLTTTTTTTTTATAAVLQRTAASMTASPPSNTTTPSSTYYIAQPGLAYAIPKEIPAVSATTTLATAHQTSSPAATALTTTEARIAISVCTPVSACVDAVSCGVRYGGCYDVNFCDGNTSPMAIPTC